jgi:hypothetical protein
MGRCTADAEVSFSLANKQPDEEHEKAARDARRKSMRCTAEAARPCVVEP